MEEEAHSHPPVVDSCLVGAASHILAGEAAGRSPADAVAAHNPAEEEAVHNRTELKVVRIPAETEVAHSLVVLAVGVDIAGENID